MTEHSARLISILRSAGYVKGSGVSTPGIALVSRLAKDNNLRDWPNVYLPEHYDALLAVTAAHLEARKV